MAEQVYLAGLLEQAQTIFNNEQFIAAKRNLSGNALLAQVEEEFERTTGPDMDDLISVAFRIEQIAIRLWLEDETEGTYRQQARDTFEAAAKLFEQIAETHASPSRRVQLDLYLHSAIDFSLGEFQANATVLARKVFDQFEFETDTHSLVLRATFLLLLRNISDLEIALATNVQDKSAFEKARRRTIVSPLTRNDAFEDIAHFITLESLLSFTRYLRTGQDAQYEVARSKIESALELFNAIRDPDNFVLTQLISLLIRQMHFSSLWYQLGDLYGFRDDPTLTRYLQILTNNNHRPIYELWQSQIEALAASLGDSSAVVLQMPTSAGKTRIAELKIIHTLATNPEPTRCIYIAPFKSLAAQVEEALDDYLSKVGYRVTSVFGSYESAEFEDLLIIQSDVLVITPEKLDYLFRQDRNFLSTVKLLVVDEGHLLDNDVRGLRLEILLERLRRTFVDQGLQILFISAVLPNSAEVAAWLTQGEPVVVDSDWKPTRLRQGIFYWGRDWKGWIRYPDEELILLTDIERKVIQAFSKRNPRKRLKKPKYYPASKYDIAIELSFECIKASPIIIFTAVRRHVDSIAKKLHQRIIEMRAAEESFHLVPGRQIALARLANKVERRLGPGFPLATYIREGFAYHHGQLPDDLRRDIETAFRSEYLPILITTPTLAQGVNLPIHLMIVAHLERGQSRPFLVRDFRNIAGRAGRALHETEGQVIFIQNTQSNWLVDQMYRYLRDDRMERVESVLFKLYEQLVQRKLNISLRQFLDRPQAVVFTDDDLDTTIELETAFQIQILALLYEELLDEADPDAVKEVLDQTLFGTQCKPDHTYYEPLVEYTQKQARYITAQFRSKVHKQAFYRTGFSLKSCQSLETEIQELATEGVFTHLRDSFTGQLDDEILARILPLVSIPQETQARYAGSVSLAQAMIRWINYANINDLVAEYGKIDPTFKNPLFVSDLVYRHFMNDAPWALNSVLKILTYLHEEEGLPFDPEFGLLSSYVKYGVNTPVAAYVSGMGLGDRNIAQKMADHYLQTNQGLLLSVENFLSWIENLTPEDLLSILKDDELVREVMVVLRRYKPNTRSVDYFTNPRAIDFRTYVVGLQYENRSKYLQGISVGDDLELVRETNNPFDIYAMAVHTTLGQRLGYIRRNWAFILSTLYDEGWRFSCKVARIYSGLRNPNRRLLVRVFHLLDNNPISF